MSRSIGTILSLRWAMIHTDPIISTNTTKTSNASAIKLLMLSGLVVMNPHLHDRQHDQRSPECWAATPARCRLGRTQRPWQAPKSEPGQIAANAFGDLAAVCAFVVGGDIAMVRRY